MSREYKFLTFSLIWIMTLVACQSPVNQNSNTHEITDFLGRKVLIPDSINKIICIRPCCLRIVAMAGGIPFLSGAEDNEVNNAEFTHTMAFPELKSLPVIGPRFGGDAELIVANQPDIIFMSTTTVGAADELQRKVQIPVVTLEAGDLGKHIDNFYKSITLIGDILGTRPHVDSVKTYIETQMKDMGDRIPSDQQTPKVYIGGITYKGMRDITATDPYYPAFTFVKAKNVAGGIDSTLISSVTGTFIDFEQLISWNPDYIFVDRAGLSLVDKNFKQKPELGKLLKAWRNNHIYMVWPYNNYHNNFEAMLLNGWYIGKCIYPDQFSDVDIRQKCNEMFQVLYGTPIYDQLAKYWGEYQQLDYCKDKASMKDYNELPH